MHPAPVKSGSYHNINTSTRFLVCSVGIFFLLVSMAPPSPDKRIRSHLNNASPIELWYFLGSLLLTAMFFEAASRLHSKLTRRKRRSDPESNSVARASSLHIRRIPLAVVNTCRIIALRWTFNISIGRSYTLNLAEVFFTVVYIIALFTLTFVNSWFIFSFTVSSLELRTSIYAATTVSGHKLDVTYWGNRSGTIAASQFPLITALGTKNNVISCEFCRQFRNSVTPLVMYPFS